ATMNGSEHVENTHVNVVPPSYATKLTPTSSTMANLRKLKANVPNDADYDVSFPLDSVHEKNEDPNQDEPSLTQTFERTRQRKEGNEKMRNYNPPEDESAPADPFLAVMNKEYDGHRRLFGRGVTNTLIKKVNGDGSASMAPREIVKSPTVSLEVEKGQSIDMQRDLEANFERRINYAVKERGWNGVRVNFLGVYDKIKSIKILAINHINFVSLTDDHAVAYGRIGEDDNAETELIILVMELENSQNNALAKLPMLKLGEYEMWEIRIKQYFQIQDYALWEVIENGNSWVPIPVTALESGPSTTLKMIVPSTAEENFCKKNVVKARSLLLMALPNEHQLTFNHMFELNLCLLRLSQIWRNTATKDSDSKGPLKHI
ncbi:hypothetical protein Tco_0045660, partial [Tanacetum coccineum]